MATKRLINAIHAFVGGDWSPTDAEIAAAMNDAPSVAPKVPVTLSASQVLGRLAAESQARVAGWVQLPAVLADIRGNDHGAVQNWTQLAFAGGVITEAERDAILAYTASEVDDPDWDTARSAAWNLCQLGRDVTAEDVAQAREEA